MSERIPPRAALYCGTAAMLLVTVVTVAGSLRPEATTMTRLLPRPAVESLEAIVVDRISVRPAGLALAPPAIELTGADLPTAVRPAGPAVVEDHLPMRPRSVLTSDELVASLTDESGTVDLFEPGRSAFAKVRDDVLRMRLQNGSHDLLAGPRWVRNRPDLQGLPLLEGGDCKLSPEEGGRLARVSKDLAPEAARIADVTDRMANVSNDPIRTSALWGSVDVEVEKSRGYDPSGLHQILQVAPPETRGHLVAKLAESADAQATKALVQRALFDLDGGVRAQAVAELERRPEESYTADLLAAFDYPWAPAAEHAADALIAMRRTDLVDELRAIVPKPDPRAPFRGDDGHWYARELVRANHLRNCLLCHAPKVDGGDPLASPAENAIDRLNTIGARVTTAPVPSGTVPDPYAPLPRTYYGSSQRGSNLLVRADITYLWQDFSVVQNVETLQSGWPKRQRFDYFVRTRRVPVDQAEQIAMTYPRERSLHRRAATYALRTLEVLRARDARLERIVASR